MTVPSAPQDEAFASVGRQGVFAGHPAGLGTLFFTELWERFSYYGMRALLTLFMVAPLAAGGLELTTAEAAMIYGNYTMAVYMLAIPGGFLADRVLGPRLAVIIGGTIIAAGHFTLAVPSPYALYAGLALVAIGTGLFKPNISALVGSLYRQGDAGRDAGFSLFYMGINIGGFVAPIVTGFLAQSAWFKAWLAANGFDPAASWHWGFGAAGVGMTLGLAHFLLRGQAVARASPGPVADPHVVRRGALVLGGTLALMALTLASDREGLTFLRYLFLALPLGLAIWLAASGDAERRRLAAIALLFVGSMLFWAIFEQAGASIALFGDRLTRTEAFGVSFPSAWFQSLNPLFVILLAPIFAWLWLRLGARQPTAPVKFGLGLAFVSASFLLMVPAAALTVEGKVSPLWLVGLFLLQTIGELLTSPVGLSAMTKLAPARAVGLVLGVWFLSMAWGNKLAGILSAGTTFAEADVLSGYFLMQAVSIAVAALAFFALAPWINRLMGGVR